MTLSEFLECDFRGDIRFRGAAYLQTERVAITRVTSERVDAVVRDGTDYQTQLLRQNDQLRMSCTCSKGKRPDTNCKHLWATILAVDEGSILAGSPKPGYIPPFTVDSKSIDFADDIFAEDFPGDLFQLSESPRRKRSNSSIALPRREWEVSLDQLRKKLEGTDSESTAAVRCREIDYVIDLEQSQHDRQLVIDVLQRQRRNDGQWGKKKPLKLRPSQLNEVDHEADRHILACLFGGTAVSTNWHAQQADLQTAVHRFQVPHELCDLLLPMMCATGRVRFPEMDESSQESLVWDDGPAWEFRMKLVVDDTQQLWRLEGLLRREPDILSLEHARLVVPGGLVLTNTHISRLEDCGAFEWVDLLRHNQSFTVPAGEENDFVDQLMYMPALPPLELPAELRLQELRPTPIPHLVIQSPPGSQWHHERLQGDVYFEYLGTLIRGSSRQGTIVQRDQGRCLLRDRPYEDQAWSQLEAHGFRRVLNRRANGHDIEIRGRDLGAAVRSIIGLDWKIRAEGQQVRQPAELRFRVKSGIDWFELHADIDFEGRTLPFPELLSALTRGDSTVRLDDGSIGIIPEDWFREYGLLGSLGVADDEHVRFATSQVGLLDALLASQKSVDYDSKFNDIREKLQTFGGISTVSEPDGFDGELRRYQREGLGWLNFLREFSFGGCLADDMGLGKTVQMLAALQIRHQKRNDKRRPSLIIVPKSLLFNWQQECTRFTPSLKVLQYIGMDRGRLRADFFEYDIVLTTYGTLRRDVLELKDIAFDYVILDEAQTIKNAGSQTAKASRLLQAQHRVALSGTPIENHLSDLWSIFEFLNPGMLGHSSIFKLFATESIDGPSRKILAQGLCPFILRRTKAQVASELPEKVEQTIYCEMGDKQHRLYQQMRDHYHHSLMGLIEHQGLKKSKIHVLEALLRLRQIACHPALLDKTSQHETSAKLDVLCPHLEELFAEGHKSLVFSQFTSMLAIVKQHLDLRKITYEYLDGKTRNRQAVIERFQTDSDCGVFLISLKAGGLGLNLTAADYVFLLDPWWNPAVEAQAIDRAHRVGQTRQVFAYRLICRDTVEEKIAKLQHKKRDLADAILQENNRMLNDLSVEDLNLLLS